MGVKDGIQGASVVMKVAFLLLFVAVVCNWIAFCTASWGYINAGGKTGWGLWRICDETASSCNVMDGTRADWFAAVQTFGIFGFMAVNVAFLLVILAMFVGACRGNGEVQLGAVILCFVAVVCWLIAVIVFGAMWRDKLLPATADDKLGSSFGLAIVTLILALIVGILLIVDGKVGGSTSPSK